MGTRGRTSPPAQPVSITDDDAALIAVVLMATSRITLGPALLVGAHVALVFSLGLIARAIRLDDDRIARVWAWRMLAPRERPAGLPGRRWARNYLQEIKLRFAKAASVVAIALAALALVLASE